MTRVKTKRLGVIGVGFKGFVPSQRVCYIGDVGSRAIHRLMEKAEEKGMLIDATSGRRTRALMVLDSGHVVLTAIAGETLLERFEKQRDLIENDELDADDGVA